jgi:hypothetical protein
MVYNILILIYKNKILRKKKNQVVTVTVIVVKRMKK